jgi:predicted DNA binding CopG/RHH family protein
MKNPIPSFTTDKEAEEFVATADLSKFDFSDMKPARFELRRKDKSVSPRLSEQLKEGFED